MVWHTNTNFLRIFFFSGFRVFWVFWVFPPFWAKTPTDITRAVMLEFFWNFAQSFLLLIPTNSRSRIFYFFLLKNLDFSIFEGFQAISRTRLGHQEEKTENPASGVCWDHWEEALYKISDELKHHSSSNVCWRFVIFAILAFWDKCV